MGLEMFVTWMVVGLLTGWLAGIVMKDGGHGRLHDLVLALIGSSAASAALSMLDLSPATLRLATALVAFGGAAAVIVLQRNFWYARG